MGLVSALNLTVGAMALFQYSRKGDVHCIFVDSYHAMFNGLYGIAVAHSGQNQELHNNTKHAIGDSANAAWGENRYIPSGIVRSFWPEGMDLYGMMYNHFYKWLFPSKPDERTLIYMIGPHEKSAKHVPELIVHSLMALGYRDTREHNVAVPPGVYGEQLI